MSDERPAVGISTCLLGEPVRYDGRSKHEPVATGPLARLFRWVPVCPEVEVGLGVPREPIRLEREGRQVRVRGVETATDVTARMDRWIVERLADLAAERLCGFVLKSRSPSCGLSSAVVHDRGGREVGLESGRFAHALLARWPDLPAVEEDALRDEGTRRAFVAAVLAVHRRREAEA